jgi:hypothetical protein
MKRTLMIFVLAAGLTTLAAPAFAHSATPRIDRREARQHARIIQGVRSGELTRGEAARLRMGQRRVHAMEWRAKRDGVVTLRERARITHLQNRQNRAIWRMKHNARAC